MRKQYLVRTEGVNLDWCVYDTQDLSTVRGGGLLLLDSATWVEQELKSRGTVQCLIKSASVGLFQLDTDLDAQSVGQLVERVLTRKLPHATFVVDVLEDSGDFPRDRDELAARNRFQQMRAPTVVYPEIRGLNPKAGACTKDNVRPGVHADGVPRDDGDWFSDATKTRRDYGRDRKQTFYQEEIREAGYTLDRDCKFTNDLEELAGDSAEWGTLQNKMAVLYLDGNNFGKLSRDTRTPQEQEQFSRKLRRAQQDFLGKLLTGPVAMPDSGWHTASGAVRLETLLWGGDEMLFVVPAWKGWELLRFFFRTFEGWEGGPSLTHGAGLVFCHRKAPIHSLRTLAKRLADVAKDLTKEEGKLQKKPVEDVFLYQVLESFDHIGIVDPKVFRPKVLRAAVMKNIESGMPVWRDCFSRKKLHKILKKPAEAGEEKKELRKEVQKQGGPASAQALAALDELERTAGDAAWEHITELWDYVGLEGRQS